VDHGNDELIKIFEIAGTDELRIGNLKEEDCPYPVMFLLESQWLG